MSMTSKVIDCALKALNITYQNTFFPETCFPYTISDPKFTDTFYNEFQNMAHKKFLNTLNHLSMPVVLWLNLSYLGSLNIRCNIISAGDDVLHPKVLQLMAEIHRGVNSIEAQPNNKTWQNGICKT